MHRYGQQNEGNQRGRSFKGGHRGSRGTNYMVTEGHSASNGEYTISTQMSYYEAVHLKFT